MCRFMGYQLVPHAFVCGSLIGDRKHPGVSNADGTNVVDGGKLGTGKEQQTAFFEGVGESGIVLHPFKCLTGSLNDFRQQVIFRNVFLTIEHPHLMIFLIDYLFIKMTGNK